MNARNPAVDGPLEVTVAGPAAASVLDLLDERYDEVTNSRTPDADTLLTIGRIDQAGERAVLNLLWDSGHQVRSVVRRRVVR